MIAAALTIGFNLLLISISIIIGLFVSVNIPLIVFDKSMHVFNILSGGNLLNDILLNNGKITWGFENIFFIIYLILAILSLIFGFFVLAKQSISTVYGFGETKNKTKKDVIKWLIVYFLSIFLVPIVFFILNSVSVVIVPIFTNYVVKTTEPFTKTQIISSILIASNSFKEIQTNIDGLISALNAQKNELIQQNVLDLQTFNALIEQLKNANNLATESFNNLNNLIGSIANEKLTDEQINTLNSSYNSVLSIKTLLENYSAYGIDFNIFVTDNDSTTQPFKNILDAESLIYDSNSGSKINLEKLLNSYDNYIRLDQIGWTNNWSAYKINYLTIQITQFVFGRPIYDLYNPFLTIGAITLTSIQTISSGSNFWIYVIKIVLFVPVISIISGIMFNMVMKLIKRVIEIIALLLMSPVVSVSTSLDDGLRWNNWSKTSLSKFLYIAIASFILMIYKLLLPQAMNLVNQIDTGSANNNDSEVIRLILNLATILGTTYGLKELIKFLSGLINERDLGDDGTGLGNKAIENWNAKTNRRKSNREKAIAKNSGKLINNRIEAIKTPKITPKIGK